MIPSEFAVWKACVLEKTIISDDFLVTYWNSNYSVEEAVLVSQAGQLSDQAKDKFDSVERCGCFHCLRFFAPQDIIWESGHAECPHCNIDAVLPETTDFVLSQALLEKLSNLKFTSNINI